MVRTIYIIILVYFLLGSIGFHFINRKKDLSEAHTNNVKLFTYFIIINILFFSIVINPDIFRILALIIIIAGLLELWYVFKKSDYEGKRFFAVSIFIFGLLSFGFFLFSGLDKGLILFSFIIISVFDSFSQITGQLWGRRKLFPQVSPKKTIEGFIGGGLFAIATALLIAGIVPSSSQTIITMATGIVIFAFVGDITASYYKRIYKVKDFSQFIPGHGGFMDRFDSLIPGGAWIAFHEYVLSV